MGNEVVRAFASGYQAVGFSGDVLWCGGFNVGSVTMPVTAGLKSQT
jgi:hypothetical protein